MKLPNNAFTLVELLISVSVITILTGALIPSFVTYVRNQNIKQAIEQVKSDLRTIQNNALNDSLPLNNNVANPLYWGIYFEKNNSHYYYFVSEDISCDGMANDNQKFILPENIYPLDTYCLFFSFENGDVFGNNYVALTNGNNIECIKLNSVGLIYTGVWNDQTASCE